MKPLRVAVIGVGHLGKEHARILAGLPDVQLVGVADSNAEQAEAVAARVGARAFGDFWPLLNLVDAVSVVVPTSWHAAVAREFLKRGIPTLIEKPLAASLAEADELVALADRHGALLQVGHIERFNPAYVELCQRRLHPLLVRAQRQGPFTGRSTDIGVVLDLMVHDLDLILNLVGAPLRSVSAAGVSIFGSHEDVASARLEFTNGCVAEVAASRASQSPSRHMQMWCQEGLAEVDFAQRKLTLVQPSESVRRHGLDPMQLSAEDRARLRDELFTRYFHVQQVDGQSCDQLTAELQQFVECARTGQSPAVSGAQARDAVAVAERIVEQIRAKAWGDAARRGPIEMPPLAA